MRHLPRILVVFAAILASVTPVATAQEAPGHGEAAANTGLITVEVLDVGQGDAILVRSPEGKLALIDAGPSQGIVPLLRRRGIEALDLVAVSHHHGDHYGGMAEVIREFRPSAFLAGDSPHTSTHYLKLLELVRDRNLRTIVPGASPRTIRLGSVTLEVFPAAPLDPHEENNNSIGLRVEFGGFSMLLPGDAEVRERAWWESNAADLCRDATVLKLAHHGSRNGTDLRWLGRVRPRLAIASLGKDNEFGHPHRETIDALARLRIPLLRTDRDGTVTIRSDGRRWQVTSHPHVETETPLAKPRVAARKGERPRHPHASPASPVDLNTSTTEELRTVPGIGPVLADRIVAGRPYRSVDDLRAIEGVGKKRLDEFRPYLVVTPR